MELITITGPTACGKTHIAVRLAQLLDGEIISADSRQVYRRMDIGTGKDLSEYENIPYHLINICEPGTKYNLHRYISDFHIALSDIICRGKQPVICGGTGLYLESALSGIRLPEVPENPELRASLADKSLESLTDLLKSYKTLHNTTDVDTAKRAIRAIEIEEFYKNSPEAASLSDRKSATPLKGKIFVLDISRDMRRHRITQRLKSRIDEGLIEEVRGLLNEGIPAEDLLYYGLEYKYVTMHILGDLSFDEMFSKLETEIHKFAKRQMTWLRGMERRGFNLIWIPYNSSPESLISTYLNTGHSCPVKE
ncbi:MAG: tRNA (adenosine(37)-N6)-dimethylallyltransferase MiaA [Clostridium sp.]|nr:tRNA (adenosine(37)-N6)-dimethylallyltransferase MiaA [Prevotella sp.]MCM1428850.1 tRNA (adenosine(37)-N6)-dimethylallyltransferase MiaA [Clostridium sp.]MCM1475225.1 tRNA (adenosine(37)-N6)-dimethylallyltransferase MiaA [Muribaculaceae bacterium]